MSGHPDLECLEALAGIGPTAEADGEAADHARGCPECSGELALLRAEQALLGRRAALVDAGLDRAALWSGVSSRLPEAGASAVVGLVVPLRPRWTRRALGTASVALAAAAAVLLSVERPVQQARLVSSGLDAAVLAEDDAPEPDPRVKRALDRAEADYARAAQVLEGEVAARQASQGTLDPEGSRKLGASLKSARARLDAARALAEDDPEARVRVLGGYARYVHSLQQTIRQSEETAP